VKWDDLWRRFPEKHSQAVADNQMYAGGRVCGAIRARTDVVGQRNGQPSCALPCRWPQTMSSSPHRDVLSAPIGVGAAMAYTVVALMGIACSCRGKLVMTAYGERCSPFLFWFAAGWPASMRICLSFV